MNIADIIADRDAGTPGPWEWDQMLYPSYLSNPSDEYVFTYIDYEGMHFEGTDATKAANARRIARVPDMEAALIAQTAEIERLRGALEKAADSLGWAEAHLEDAGVKSAQVTFGERNAREALKGGAE